MNQGEPLINRWVRIASTDAIPLREGRAVQIAGHEIAVFSLGDRFLAVENKCPHRGGPLADGIISGNNIVCPLHAWKIDLASGEVLNQAADTKCIRTFATRVEDGILLLEIPVGPTVAAQLPPDSLATISQGFYLTRTASREV